VLRFDRQERLGPTPPAAVVLTYDGNVGIPTVRPGRRAALLRLVLPPADADAVSTVAAARDGAPLGRYVAQQRLAEGRASPPPGTLQVLRRARKVPWSEVLGWERLAMTNAGTTASWLHQEGDDSVVVLARAQDGGVDTVRTVLATPDRLLPRRPALELTDPTWGPMLPVDLAAFGDVEAWAGADPAASAGAPGTGDAETGDPSTGGSSRSVPAQRQFAPLAVSNDVRGRIAVIEIRTPSRRSVALVAWKGARVGCTATRDYADLAVRALVVLGCRDPLSGDLVLAAVARPGVGRVELDHVPGETRQVVGSAPIVRRLPASATVTRPVTATAVDVDGVVVGTDQVPVSALRGRRR
jgi:hypothetical protein